MEKLISQFLQLKETGRYIMIGEGCDIDLVQYSENIEISPKAKVKKCEKI